MDYTPGVISYEYFIDPIGSPERDIDHKSTVSHQLSLITLFESGIIHLADHHYHYEHLPTLAKDMLRGIPTSWDETKFVEGYPSDYVVLARRKGLNWYISGINADTTSSQSITINSTFASPGVYHFKAMKDGATKSDLDLTVGDYKTDSTIAITMAPYGGFTYVLEAKCLDALNLTMTNEGVTDSIYKAKGINMTNKIKSPSKVTSSADNFVVMEAPFQVESGSVFKAEIGGCL